MIEYILSTHLSADSKSGHAHALIIIWSRKLIKDSWPNCISKNDGAYCYQVGPERGVGAATWNLYTRSKYCGMIRRAERAPSFSEQWPSKWMSGRITHERPNILPSAQVFYQWGLVLTVGGSATPSCSLPPNATAVPTCARDMWLHFPHLHVHSMVRENDNGRF